MWRSCFWVAWSLPVAFSVEVSQLPWLLLCCGWLWYIFSTENHCVADTCLKGSIMRVTEGHEDAKNLCPITVSPGLRISSKSSSMQPQNYNTSIFMLGYSPWHSCTLYATSGCFLNLCSWFCLVWNEISLSVTLTLNLLHDSQKTSPMAPRCLPSPDTFYTSSRCPLPVYQHMHSPAL